MFVTPVKFVHICTHENDLLKEMHEETCPIGKAERVLRRTR